MEPHLTSANSSVATRRDSLGLSTTLDLLEDVDFESTMMVLEQSERGNTSSSGMTPAASRRRVSSILRRGSMEPLDLSLTSLAELFPSNGESDGLHFLTDEFVAAALSQAAGLPSPSCRLSATSTSNGADLKIRLPCRSPSIIKSEFPHSPVMLSPTMDSFLRDSWDDISDLATKTRRASSKLLEGLLGNHSLLSPTGATPRRLSVKLPCAATLQMILPGTPTVLAARTTKSSAAASTKQQLKQPKPTTKSVRASSKQPRRAKQCVEDGCPRRAQSNNRCKTHGGGARCQMSGCDKSSQGGGLCRAHGGGKKCRVAGCTKGTQRLGLCYLHGGIRRCIQEGCKKKDRGNGFCISHGGGRRCEVTGCTRSVRKGNHCQTHQGLAEQEVPSTLTGSESPFQISRGLQLHATS